MSLGVAFKGPEGVVLAADSRVTLSAQLPNGQEIPSHWDNATKLLSLEGQRYVGIVTYGAGAIMQTSGPRAAHSFIPEFESVLAEAYEGRATVEQVAQALSDFYADQWQQAGMPPGDPNVTMVFVVAGYDEGDAYGKVFQVTIPTAPAPIEQSPGGFGISVGGQQEYVARLIGGVDLGAAEVAKQALNLTDTQQDQLTQAFSALHLAIPYQFLPLQDSVDLSTFLVHMTTTVQGWTIGLRGVGGAVDVATITRTDGFQSVKQKQVQVKE